MNNLTSKSEPCADSSDTSDPLARPDQPLKVVAIVAGGVVQGALGSRPDIEFEVLDHDNFHCAKEINGEREAEADARLTQECPHTIY